MSTVNGTAYSNYKGLEALDKGSYNDCGDGTPAKQTLLCNVDELAQAIADAVGSGDKSMKVETEIANLVVGTNTIVSECLNTITDVTFFDELQNQIEIAYKILAPGNQVEVCTNLDINNVTIRLEGV